MVWGIQCILCIVTPLTNSGSTVNTGRVLATGPNERQVLVAGGGVSDEEFEARM